MSTKKKENKKYWELKTKLQGAEQRDHLKCSARDTRARHNREANAKKEQRRREDRSRRKVRGKHSKRTTGVSEDYPTQWNAENAGSIAHKKPS